MLYKGNTHYNFLPIPNYSVTCFWFLRFFLL